MIFNKLTSVEGLINLTGYPVGNTIKANSEQFTAMAEIIEQNYCSVTLWCSGSSGAIAAGFISSLSSKSECNSVCT